MPLDFVVEVGGQGGFGAIVWPEFLFSLLCDEKASSDLTTIPAHVIIAISVIIPISVCYNSHNVLTALTVRSISSLLLEIIIL